MENQTTKKRKVVVMTKDNKLGFVYQNEYVESNGIDKIPVYLIDGINPTGEKLLCNPQGLILMGIH